MKVFVIIVTYNGSQWIEKCLTSVLNASIPLETIVIDNSSTDNTVDMIEERFSGIILIKSKKNLGFGQANNIGLKYALEHQCDYVYLLNQDAWIEPTTIETLIHLSRKNPDFGIISPMQITPKGDKLESFFAHCCKVMIDDLYFSTLKDIYEVDDVMAAHWLITRACLMSVGGFSPVFYHYGEDNNMVERAQYHGFKCGISPRARGVHDREFRKLTKQQIMCFIYVAVLIGSSDIRTSRKEKIKGFIVFIYKVFLNAFRYKSLVPFLYLFKFPFMCLWIFKYNRITRKRQISFL